MITKIITCLLTFNGALECHNEGINSDNSRNIMENVRFIEFDNTNQSVDKSQTDGTGNPINHGEQKAETDGTG